MPSVQDLQANSVIFLQILADAVYQNPCCMKSLAAVTQTCAAWHEFCRTSSLIAKTWILPEILNAAPDVRTKRLMDRVCAHATDAAGNSKFFCIDSDGQLTNVLTKDAADNIKNTININNHDLLK